MHAFFVGQKEELFTGLTVDCLATLLKHMSSCEAKAEQEYASKRKLSRSVDIS